MMRLNDEWLGKSGVSPGGDPDWKTAISQGELVAAAVAARGDTGSEMDRLQRALRAATVLVPRDCDGDGRDRVALVQRDGLTWVPVFSSLATIEGYAAAVGRDVTEIRYSTVSGAELISEVLPGLPRRTGVVLDPVQPHVYALPAQVLVAELPNPVACRDL